MIFSTTKFILTIPTWRRKVLERPPTGRWTSSLFIQFECEKESIGGTSCSFPDSFRGNWGTIARNRSVPGGSRSKQVLWIYTKLCFFLEGVPREEWMIENEYYQSFFKLYEKYSDEQNWTDMDLLTLIIFCQVFARRIQKKKNTCCFGFSKKILRSCCYRYSDKYKLFFWSQSQLSWKIVIWQSTYN